MLRSLSLGWCHLLTDSEVGHVAALGSLTSLDLCRTKARLTSAAALFLMEVPGQSFEDSLIH